MIDTFINRNKKNIIFHGYMGIPSGNNLALYNYVRKKKSFECELWWTGGTLDCDMIDSKFTRQTPKRNASVIEHISYLFFLMRFKVLIFESAGDLSFYSRFLPRQRRIKVLLLHGFGIKSCGILAPNLSLEQKRIWSKVGNSFDLFSVSSKIEKYMLSSTFNGSVNKFKVIGPQRLMKNNDFSHSEKIYARKLIVDTYKVKLTEIDKLVVYAPTHRDHLVQGNRSVLFGFENLLQLNKLLVEYDTFLLVREHVIETEVFPECYSNIIYTSNKKYIDFNKIAPGIDGLITDYSGIFLEYLNTNIKLGFWQYDYKDYLKSRGFSIADSIFKSGWNIKDCETLKDFLKKSNISSNMKITRSVWHSSIYENTTAEALKKTVEEVMKLYKSK